MKRDIYAKFLAWKSSSGRKPLLLQGSRQTGKTFILKEFGRNEYGKVVYCNFEEDPGLGQFFQRDLNPERILSELSIYTNLEIHPEADLIIFDEIQVSNRALNSLKYFAEQKSDVHIAAAGSLLGVKLSGHGSFPVGKVNFLHLYPMTFMEFLDAMGKSRYRKLIENVEALCFAVIILLGVCRKLSSTLPRRVTDGRPERFRKESSNPMFLILPSMPRQPTYPSLH
jgi:predicted AAA+ superfamily ATPase